MHSLGEYVKHEVAMVPMVSSMAFTTVPPKRGHPAPAAVVVEGYDIKAKDDVVTSLVINPCTRTPARGVSWEESEKPFFVHPFWAMKRVAQGEEEDKVNMEIVFIRLDEVFNVNFGSTVEVPGASAPAAASTYSSVQVPVARNMRAIKFDEPLVLPVMKQKRAKKEENVTWDSKPRDKAEGRGKLSESVEAFV